MIVTYMMKINGLKTNKQTNKNKLYNYYELVGDFTQQNSAPNLLLWLPEFPDNLPLLFNDDI